MFAFYRLILNLLGTEGTLFHDRYFPAWQFKQKEGIAQSPGIVLSFVEDISI